MKLNFVVESVYCCHLVAGAQPLLGISALDIWLVYLLMIVIAVALMHDGPTAVTLTLLVDLVICLANSHY